jgi:hypothetical protein
MDRAGYIIDVEQIFGVPPAPDRAEARPDARDRRKRERGLAIVRDVNANAWLRQSE